MPKYFVKCFDGYQSASNPRIKFFSQQIPFAHLIWSRSIHNQASFFHSINGFFHFLTCFSANMNTCLLPSSTQSLLTCW